MKQGSIAILAIVLGIVVLGSSPVFALTMTVDGAVSDWGITVADNNGSSWTPTAGIFYSAGEDQFNDNSNSGQVFPGYGGQRYDAEGLYATYDADFLYLLVVTGLRPEGWKWKPGDIAIAFDNDITQAEFGVETTGGNAGGLYNNITWGHGLSNWSGVSDPTEIVSGHLLGGNDLVYQQVSEQHYVIETKIDLSLFGDYWQEGKNFKAHWTMTCGNDAVDIDPVPITTVPEPSMLLLIGLGLVGIAGVSRKHLKK